MEQQNEQRGGTPPKRSTSSFPGVLIAIVALIIIGLVGWKLLQPAPTPPVPEQSPAAGATTPPVAEGAPQKPSEVDTGLATNTADPICGMNPQASALRVEAQFDDNSRLAFDSLACYYRYIEKNPKPAVKSERVVDFNTYQDAKPVLLDFAKAVWLIDLKSSAPGAMPPGAAAFATKEEAGKAIADLGGKVTDAAGMKAYIYDYLKKNGLL